MAAKTSPSHHQVSFDHPIKSIITDSEGQFLLIETVNSTNKEQTFYLLSYASLEIIQAISFDEDYSGLVLKSYDSDRLLFIQYADQNNPDHTNIYAFKWSGGEPYLHLSNTQILQSGSQWIQIPHPHFENRQIYIDLITGKEINSPNEESPSTLTELEYASAYTDASDYFNWFEQYFNPHDIIPVRQIEYLKTKSRILISYYSQANDSISNSLAILDDDGKMLERILLEEQLTGIGKDTFFVFRNKAIFVTQRKTLNIYDL